MFRSSLQKQNRTIDIRLKGAYVMNDFIMDIISSHYNNDRMQAARIYNMLIYCSILTGKLNQ